MLNNTVVLITGGTGSFGKKFTEMLLNNYKVKKIIIVIVVIVAVIGVAAMVILSQKRR